MEATFNFAQVMLLVSITAVAFFVFGAVFAGWLVAFILRHDKERDKDRRWPG